MLRGWESDGWSGTASQFQVQGLQKGDELPVYPLLLNSSMLLQ